MISNLKLYLPCYVNSSTELLLSLQGTAGKGNKLPFNFFENGSKNIYCFFAAFEDKAQLRLFFANCEPGSIFKACIQASIPLSHIFSSLYAAQMLLYAGA